ncbi:c-type cytochrome [Rhodoferax antarcticus]|uniref:c-type cytochrome n=1 Tax=Rhodoferax antarcticus TaxID=81479 RepID=UPI002224E76C|nr:cytochrome c [Rhodoferax antarcticus]MCW2313920.1 cytochrome c556 [Rhodoferax antarcticus]
MKKITALALAIGALAATFVAPASAQFAKPADAVEYRQGAFTVMQHHFGQVAGMAAGKIPFDAKVAAESAVVAEYVGKLPFAAFGPGTNKGDTKAKASIWTNKAKFDDYASNMQVEMTKLTAAANTGNLDAIKVAVNAAGGTCKSCHDDFKSK